MLRKLVHHALKVKSTDRICILYDDSRESIVIPLSEILEERVHAERVPDRLTCNNLPGNVKDILLGEDFNVIVICISQEQAIWHSNERKKAKYKLGKRLSSVIAPYEFLRDNAFDVDMTFIRSLGNFVRKKLKPEALIHILGESGTDLYARIGKEPFCEDGDYSAANSGGDFPAGEAGFAPVVLTVEGKLAYDLKIQHIGTVSADDVIINVQKDQVTDVAGRKSEAFEGLMSSNEVLKYISEISFGLNPVIGIFDNITNIIEEKKAGTVHFGHGGNSAYGDRVGPHFDCVINTPTVMIDGESFMRKGKFVDNDMPRGLIEKLSKYNLVCDEM